MSPPVYILRVGAEVAMCLHGPAGVSHLEHWQSLCRVLMLCHLPRHNTTPAIVHTVIIIHPITLTPATLLHTSACRPSSPALQHCLFLHVSVLFCCVVRLSLKMRERPPCNVVCIVYYSILDVECIISLLLIILLLRMPMFPTNFVFCNVPVLIGTDTTFTAATNNFVFPRYFMTSFYYFTLFVIFCE